MNLKDEWIVTALCAGGGIALAASLADHGTPLWLAVPAAALVALAWWAWLMLWARGRRKAGDRGE